MFEKQGPLSETLKQQVYQIIKDQICQGIYNPGEWLQEKELANKFKISRSPVREALRQLASDGLVEVVPHKGVFVKEVTAKDIEDIFDIRMLLESYAIEKAPKKLDDEKILLLQNCVDSLVTTHREDNLALYIEYDTILHNMLIDISGNEILKTTYERIHYMIMPFRVYSLTTKERFDESVIEHKGIIENIFNGNIQESKRLMKIHLELAKEKLQEYIIGLAGNQG
ncbi:MAG: GntR family transcriptional regulator [Clostridiales bacterium]|nr:GntR family transcriptional regulator [Clostridiales bacterium]